MLELTTMQIDAYRNDGFIIVPGFYSKEEISKLYETAIHDRVISNNAINVNDSTGKNSKLSLWFKPGDDTYGLLTRGESLVNAVDHLMDGSSPVCHFHSKLMQKEPLVGGAWEWHQDYGYWYKNQFLLPDQMMSVMVAVTDANRLNGCLQVIKGSHKIGRVEHGFSGEQTGASQIYVDLALKTMKHVYVELKAGDVLFFHSNLFHRSEANLSETARWSLISCYNRQDNFSYHKSPKDISSGTPIETVPDSALLNNDIKGLDAQESLVMKKEEDVSLKD
jgi:ectoine hydroxylase-related dioxygenase (phytanoyl-CoA dioxygenase family)